MDEEATGITDQNCQRNSNGRPGHHADEGNRNGTQDPSEKTYPCAYIYEGIDLSKGISGQLLEGRIQVAAEGQVGTGAGQEALKSRVRGSL